MGCCNSRPLDGLDMQSSENSQKMDRNISLLRCLFYILLKADKIGLAIFIHALLQKTEEYYRIIRTYRAHYIQYAREQDKEMHGSNLAKDQCRSLMRHEAADLDITFNVFQQICQREEGLVRTTDDYVFRLQELQLQMYDMATNVQNKIREAQMNKVSLEIVLQEVCGVRGLSPEDKKVFRQVKENTIDRYAKEEQRYYLTPEIKGYIRSSTF